MFRVKQSVYGVQIGSRYGKWEVIGQPFSVGRKHWMAVARCECGRIKAIDCSSLSSGNSGGCKPCHTRKHRTTHGEFANGGKAARLRTIWNGMRQRCTNPNHPAWKDYGGRGIQVCCEWRRYEAFRDWSLANGYGDDKQIDRFPDNDSGYRPDNCRWVPCKINQRNRRSNLIIEAFGESKSLAEWLEDERCVVKWGALQWRIARGWNPETALTTPAKAKAAA